jgi:hypothetical protein
VPRGVRNQPRFVPAPDAVQETMRVADPALDVAGHALAAAIPEKVPVSEGVAVRTYRPSVARMGIGRVVVGIHSPFWHFIEYGTRWNPPYRPIQRAAESIGLEYTPL